MGDLDMNLPGLSTTQLKIKLPVCKRIFKEEYHIHITGKFTPPDQVSRDGKHAANTIMPLDEATVLLSVVRDGMDEFICFPKDLAVRILAC